jgi:hypothetical protein
MSFSSGVTHAQFGTDSQLANFLFGWEFHWIRLCLWGNCEEIWNWCISSGWRIWESGSFHFFRFPLLNPFNLSHNQSTLIEIRHPLGLILSNQPICCSFIVSDGSSFILGGFPQDPTPQTPTQSHSIRFSQTKIVYSMKTENQQDFPCPKESRWSRLTDGSLSSPISNFICFNYLGNWMTS